MGHRFVLKRALKTASLGVGFSLSHKCLQVTSKRLRTNIPKLRRAGQLRAAGAKVGCLARAGPSASTLY
eukprot:9352173-Alexandrium_andersonii.AAC.1